MILEYTDFGSGKPIKVKAKVTTSHPASSYGKPVIVLEDGGALDLFSWCCLGYRIIKATAREQSLLDAVFRDIDWGIKNQGREK